RDGGAIRMFCEDLVESIGMVAYGEPILEHFATHLPEAAGYSLVQLIETSAVTGHFCDASGDVYLDVFSCKDFDPEVAIEAVERHFSPKSIARKALIRDASPNAEEAVA
ncbi:MAG: S-adenosylmethionine decarboxylase, partial [Gammaproteobacteria bacterium]